MELLGMSTYEEREQRYCPKDEHQTRGRTVRLFGMNNLKKGADVMARE
jgi:hypothetical protein